MAKFKLGFDTDNAAFEDNGAAEVVGRLRVVLDRVKKGEYAGLIYDSNGNFIGSWSWR